MTSTNVLRPPALGEVEPDQPADREPRSLPIGKLMLLLPLQLFLAAGWMRAGVEKVIDPTWWSGDYLTTFLEEQREHMLPFFIPFTDNILVPIAPAVAWLVLVTQLGIAACLFTNRHTRAALWAGIVLNLTFTMAGRVNPSAFYLVMQMAMLFALSRPVTPRIAMRRAALWLVPAALFVPFIRTIHPAEVIDDPASMISFVSVLAAVTTVAIVDQPTQLLDMAASTTVGRRVVERTGVSPQRLVTRLSGAPRTSDRLQPASTRSFDLSSSD